MATMTASVRGTPSFAPVPTQNTALVHEFRCLFTHDGHKKAKKWHDGSVRFHTFNRRAMVYDDGKNYIGDYHYGHEEFAEGVELRLDRGALVEVGERLGETQTDVSSILDRRKDDSSSQPVRNIRLVAAASQHESKSLSQILGTQPRIGRARTLPSPYQQRQALGSVQPVERSVPPPLKRQKVDVSEQENRRVSPLQEDTLGQRVVRRVEPKLPKPRPVPKSAPAVDFQEVLDLSSDEAIAKSAPKQHPKVKKTPIQKLASAPSPQSKPKEMTWPNKEPAAIVFQKRAEPIRSDVSQRAADSKQLTTTDQQPPQETSSRARISQPGASSHSGRTQLLLRSPKPRRKMMYRALLPSAKPQPGSLAAPSPPKCKAHIPNLPFTSESNLVDFAGHHDSPPERQSESRRGSIFEPLDVSSSQFFIPEDGRHRSPSKSLPFSQNSLEASLLGRPSTTSEVEAETQKDSSQVSQGRSSVISGAEQDAAEPMVLADPFPTNRKQMLPPPLPISVPLQPANKPSPWVRPFRRIRSENDAFQEARDDFPDLDGFSVRPPSFLAKAKASPARMFRSSPKSPVKLRRTASDSAIMDNNDERAVGYKVEPILEDLGETGAWTTVEAYLLFEWWPPGKTRPDYGAPCYTDVQAGQFAPGRAAITTARDMLRDEINVL